MDRAWAGPIHAPHVLIRPLLACLTALLRLFGSAAPVWADFALPPLPDGPEALEPAIDATTMTLHHDRHHAADVANLKAQIKANTERHAYREADASGLLEQLSHKSIASID